MLRSRGVGNCYERLIWKLKKVEMELRRNMNTFTWIFVPICRKMNLLLFLRFQMLEQQVLQSRLQVTTAVVICFVLYLIVVVSFITTRRRNTCVAQCPDAP